MWSNNLVINKRGSYDTRGNSTPKPQAKTSKYTIFAKRSKTAAVCVCVCVLPMGINTDFPVVINIMTDATQLFKDLYAAFILNHQRHQSCNKGNKFITST